MNSLRGLTLLNVGGNAKTVKSDNGGEYLTAIMYLAPADLAVSKGTLCPYADLAGCKAGCLNTAGRGRFDRTKQARARKSRMYETDRQGFMRALVCDLMVFHAYCIYRGVLPCVRLNGTSDIPWERVPVDIQGFTYDNIMSAFPDTQFYDYTKVYTRVKPGVVPANYSLTLSYSEANDNYRDKVVQYATRHGATLAVVFRSKDGLAKAITSGFLGRKVIDGDAHDLRFTDPANSVVGLSAKGLAKRDTSGFVLD